MLICCSQYRKKPKYKMDKKNNKKPYKPDFIIAHQRIRSCLAPEWTDTHI